MNDVMKLKGMFADYVAAEEEAKSKPFTRGDILVIRESIGNRSKGVVYAVFGEYFTPDDISALHALDDDDKQETAFKLLDIDAYAFTFGEYDQRRMLAERWSPEEGIKAAHVIQFKADRHCWQPRAIPSLHHRKMSEDELNALPENIREVLQEVSERIRAPYTEYRSGDLVVSTRSRSGEKIVGVFDRYTTTIAPTRVTSGFDDLGPYEGVFLSRIRLAVLTKNDEFAWMDSSISLISPYSGEEEDASCQAYRECTCPVCSAARKGDDGKLIEGEITLAKIDEMVAARSYVGVAKFAKMLGDLSDVPAEVRDRAVFEAKRKAMITMLHVRDAITEEQVEQLFEEMKAERKIQ